VPCFYPLQGWRSRVAGASGKFPIVFEKAHGFGPEVLLPCGRCIGCRLEQSRQWAVRLMHEAQLHEYSYFLTLTYSPENLPADGSLDKSHFQGFMKRLRKRFSTERMRFFHCGEYGEQLFRPHYHCILYGLDLPDKLVYQNVPGGRLYTSAILESTWGRGFCSMGDVTFESCAYVARYVTKKVTGERADEHYMRVSPDGEVVKLQPEYVTMSRRPGIARAWFARYASDVFPSDEVISRGMPGKPPRFYDKLFEAAHGEQFAAIKAERERAQRERAFDATPSRLRVREAVARARLRQGARRLEGSGKP